MAYRGTGDDEAEGMDRIARIGRQHDVARAGDRLRQIGDAFLGTERNDDFGFRIEVDVEAPLIVAGECTTQPWHAAAAGVAVRAWIAHGFDKLLDDMGWCRTVGIDRKGVVEGKRG